MTPDRWQTVTSLFDKAVRLPIAQRDAFLVAVCGADTELLTEVRSLLEVHTDDPQYLEESALASHGEVLEEAIEAQTREDHVGPYRLVRKIGAGGMGTVYLAERDDAEFDKKVAIKFIRGGSIRETAVKRFRRERQILARLEHPGIARLLDGGTTDKGTPYFVMEYVEGQLLLDYCDQHGMGVRSRIELFLKVCEAVEYAHERLIVHRDLKASNILVDERGQPKLLDFGIAKVLQADEDGQMTLTQTGLRQFTPDYASPEQIKGEQVTTATDVYSLGVLLYELLTGRRPFRFHGQPAVEILSTLLEREPARPSSVIWRKEEDQNKVIRPELVVWNRRTDLKTLSRTLSGDLDNIILKALAKQPSERYRTAAALANDLRAYLDGHVVSARTSTVSYRVRKFLGRNKWQATMGAALLLTLFGALGVATWQWRVARSERLRAEHHSRQSREMARALLIDLYGSLRDVPGATEARRLLLDRATTFLNELSQGAEDDPELQLELAEGYRKLAAVQGDLRSENLGERAAALDIYQKALTVLDALLDSSRYGQRALSLKLSTLCDLAVAQDDLDQREARAPTITQLEQLLKRADAIKSPSPDLELSRAIGFRQYGAAKVSNGDYASGQKAYLRSKEIFQALLAGDNASAETRQQYAFTLKRLGALYISERQLPEASELYTEALQIERNLLANNPKDMERRYAMSFSLSDLGYIERERGKFDQALKLYQEALDIREAALEANPKDERAKAGIASTLNYMATIYRRLGWFDQALSAHQRSLSIRDELANRHPDSKNYQLDLARARANLAETLIEQSKTERSTHTKTVSIQRSRNLLRQAIPVYEAREAAKELIGADVGQASYLRGLLDSLDSL